MAPGDPSSCEEARTSPPVASETEVAPTYTRDLQYYFEDGSIVLLVKDVHASLIKAESQVFKDMFTMPNNDSAGRDGASDQRPVNIPQVEPEQFRNLLKMFYCPPSSRFYLSLQGDCTAPWDHFKIYLDIASLSHRFAMASLEQWAKIQLIQLFSSFGERVIKKHEWDHSAALVLLDAIKYAQIIQDQKLTNGLKNLLQFYLSRTDWTGLSELFEMFRRPGLRVEHPSLFGFLFILLLRFNRDTWRQEEFTKADRAALYPALVDLTPLPESLKLSIRTPLFVKPTDLDIFRNHFVPDPSSPVIPEPCSKGCDQVMMDKWFEVFVNMYYERIASDSVSGPTLWLSVLPAYRLEWTKRSRERFKDMKCGDCYARYIDQLDQDLEVLFTRIGEYHHEVE